MTKNIITAVLAIVVLFSGTILDGCSFKDFNTSGETIKVVKSEQAFGTIMTITLFGKDKTHLENIENKAFEEIGRLENVFSAKLSNSELSLLNSKAYEETVSISDELFYVLDKALEYNILSNGALDVSIGNIVDMWAIGTENERVPEESELKDYIGINGCEYVELNESDKTVHFLDSRVKLDLGAVAKGYAADVVKKYILEMDSQAYGILNFGGNVMTIKEKENNEAWVIGITNPFRTDGAYFTLNIKDKCVVTSGDYERYFEENGVRYHHILDSRTGYPAQNDIASASIIGENSLECDALSTACFILGVDKGMELIDSIDSVEAVFIDKEGQCHTSKGIDSYSFNLLAE
ncbi:MAG: FAD:protein FMN transferase [Lachnospira sp.]